MSNITYQSFTNHTSVYLDGKFVGRIHEVTGGFQYIPTGIKNGGEIYKSIRQVKQSLEEA
jgi:hypothetical protein